MNRPAFRLEQATERDLGLILRFIRELGAYEQLAHEVTATEEELRETLFGLQPAAEVVIAMNLGYRSGTPKPQVNGRFPASRHVRIWPALVVALPPLPNELEYRVFGGDLVLVDLHADLVVDILTGVLRSPFAELSRDSAPPRKSPHALAARVR